MLFDELKKRTCTEGKCIGQTNYDFLDQSSLEEHIQIRKFLNLCFSKINEASKHEIKARVHSPLESVFHAVCFELIINHLFITLGCSLEEHPEVQGTEKHPDFLVTLPNGKQFYLELVTINEYDDSSIDDLEHFVEKLKNEHCFANIKEITGRKISHNDNIELRKLILNWWHENNTKIVSPVTFENKSKDLQIKIEILPNSSSAISSYMGIIKFHSQLVSKLKKKANRYGEFNLPYIIATTFRPSRFSAGIQLMENLIIDSLYGGNIYNPDSQKIEPIRSLWSVDSKNKTYSNVSGVFFFDELTVMRALAPFKYCLFINHFAKNAVPEEIKDWFNIFYIDGENTYSKLGYDISKLLTETLSMSK